MTPRPAIVAAAALAAVAAGALLLRRRLDDEAAQGAALPGLSFDNVAEEIFAPFGNRMMNDPQADANLRAFSDMVAIAEGTARYPDPYRVMFGGRIFAGELTDHPRQPMQFTDNKGRRLWSSAAGKHQWLARSPLPDGSGRWTTVDTWDRFARRLELPDFGPESQERAFAAQLDELGALRDVQEGRFDAAVGKCRKVWASLPGAGYAQPERSLEYIRAAYVNAGGVIA